MQQMKHSVELIQDSVELHNCIINLNSKKEIAFDLEFDKNYYRFGFNLCLVQIFDGKTCYLIDPLSRKLNISKLFQILENPEIIKICFSVDEDLRLLHSLGCFPKNLYDIEIASRLLNYPAMSLTNLLIEVLGIDPGESSQLSNWFRRPLTTKQVSYAASDVLHLPLLKKNLAEKAGGSEVEGWIKEENRKLDHLDYSNAANNHIIKEKEKREFNEVEWHIYKKLIRWRHELARKYNKPDFQLIDKKSLTNITKKSTNGINWMEMPGVFKKIKTEYYAVELNQLLKDSRAEASEKGLSENEPAQKPLSQEEYNQILDERRKISELRKSFFDPVKASISNKYGAETANFMMSNRAISDMITGKYGPVENYKKELINHTAGELGLDLSLGNLLTRHANDDQALI